jgi:glutathione S-transferase
MKLYTKPGACSLADHIALIWSGLPFEFQIVDAATMKSPEFLAMNPAGAVPVLEDGGWVLTQNAAILHYICDKAPAAGLDGGSDPRTRGEVNRWLSFVNADVHPAFHPLFGSTRFLEDEAMIARTQEHARARLKGLFQRLNDQLAQYDWLGGTARASVADAYAYVVLRWARGLKIDLAGMDAVDRFEQRMLADAAVQTALKDEGLS